MTLTACGEVASWTNVILVECSEVAVVEIEVASVATGVMDRGAPGSPPGSPPGTLMEQIRGRRGGHRGPGKMDKGEHHQEHREALLDAETLQSCIYYQLYFLHQKMF